MKIMILAIFLIVCQPIFASAFSIQRAEISNGCGVIIQLSDVQNADEELILDSVKSLVCPQDNSRKFNVRYIWMNHIQTSLLLADYSDKSFEAVLGKRPIILENEVIDKIRQLHTNYGVRLTDGNSLYGGMNNTKLLRVGSNELIAQDSNEGLERKIPVSIRRKMRILPLEDRLIWPILHNPENFITPINWPDKYKAHYSRLYGGIERDKSSRAIIRKLNKSAKRNWRTLADTLASCMRLYKYASHEEFNTYWSRVEQLQSLLESDKLERELIAGGSGDADGDIIVNIQNNPLYDLIAEFTSKSWPRDFLHIEGEFNQGEPQECVGGTDGGVSFTAIPRKLFFLVAVLEPVVEEITIEQVSFRPDTSSTLRTKNTYQQSMEQATPHITLKKADGNTLIIPMAIELRYDSLPSVNEEISLYSTLADTTLNDGIGSLIDNYGQRKIVFDICEEPVTGEEKRNELCSSFFSGLLGEFMKPTVPIIPEKTYLFGPSIQIDSIQVGTKKFEIRDAPKLALYTEGVWQGGSCPFLLFVMEDGKTSYHGRVLIGANSRSKIRTETIPIPTGAKYAVIAEIEPEVSYITNFSFHDIDPKRLIKQRSFALKPRQNAKIKIPVDATNISITGYYRLLTDQRQN